MAEVSLTVLGLRRVGVSLGLALKRYQTSPHAAHKFTITGADRDQDAGKEAQKLGAIDRYVRNVNDACAAADIVFIDASLADTQAYLEAIGSVLKAGCVVLETAPLKQPPIQWAARYLPESAYLVGLAPVFNPDALYTAAAVTDLTTASADLFHNGNLYIAAAPTCPAEAIQLASDLVKLLGPEPHYMEPAEHDGFVAVVELLPALLGLTEFAVAASAPSWLDSRRLTNPAFALSTAPLLHNPADLADFLTLDRENVLHHLDRAIDQLAALRGLLAQADLKALNATLAEITTQYASWLSQRESGNWKDKAQIEVPPMRSGLMQSLFGGLVGRGRKDEEKD